MSNVFYKLALIGYPLGHSVSPLIHNAALKHCNLNGDYTLLETPPEDIVDRVKYLKIYNYRGFNVTIPLKIYIAPFLEDVDEYANLAGAVNTVKIEDNKFMYGYNTDIAGFINAIPEEKKAALEGGTAFVYGTGGAARAVLVALNALGVKDIRFYARNPEKALNFVKNSCSKFDGLELSLYEQDYFADLSEANIVVNTTPLGMKGANQDISPFDQKSADTLKEDTIIYDLVYNPRNTLMLKYAKERNLFTIDGLEMLVQQGAKAFEIWTDEKAPLDLMRSVAIEELNQN